MANTFPNSPTRGISLQPQKLAVGAVILLLLIAVYSSFYTVPVDSVAVILRFGAPNDTTEPGLHFKLPFGIDTVEVVPVRRQLKLEFGFGTAGATNRWQYTGDAEEERAMVTGDLNAAGVEWVVQYQISDPKEFLFEFNDPTATLRDISESVMREVVGDRTIDEVLTFGRQEMAMKGHERLQTVVTGLHMGLRIDQVQMGNVNPPQEVQASFDEVNKAQQEKEQAINEAHRQYNSEVPRARGEAEQKVSASTGYAVKRLNEAEGDANRFNALLAEYNKAPDVTRRRIYLETMNEVLAAVKGTVIIDDKAQSFLPMLQLKQSRSQPAAAPAPTSNRVSTSR